jgi:hypothetical protein
MRISERGGPSATSFIGMVGSSMVPGDGGTVGTDCAKADVEKTIRAARNAESREALNIAA